MKRLPFHPRGRDINAFYHSNNIFKDNMGNNLKIKENGLKIKNSNAKPVSKPGETQVSENNVSGTKVSETKVKESEMSKTKVSEPKVSNTKLASGETAVQAKLRKEEKSVNDTKITNKNDTRNFRKTVMTYPNME